MRPNLPWFSNQTRTTMRAKKYSAIDLKDIEQKASTKY